MHSTKVQEELDIGIAFPNAVMAKNAIPQTMVTADSAVKVHQHKFVMHGKCQVVERSTLCHLQIGDDADRTFSKQLLGVGNGTSVGEKDGWVSLPSGHMVSDLMELMNKMFPNLKNQFTDHKWLKTYAILAPKNVALDDLNFKLLEQLPGESHIYNFIDTVLKMDEAVNYPVEFLNSLTPPGLPPHNLHLKIGAPVKLLRNLDPPKLCKGT
ncbi:ATP-dependent DNA helicase PIF1-like [Octopus vulgaris]|uniref:ATP-dependent DNA helicase PIF1-like n=1 Tax=Octopus vulgaris TaxID=6645 RepID=A0AA36BVL5_OCTVU|nr:ATP-dependent DNA helicase PIF1-like [Octopus vulgaris]